MERILQSKALPGHGCDSKEVNVDVPLKAKHVVTVRLTDDDLRVARHLMRTFGVSRSKVLVWSLRALGDEHERTAAQVAPLAQAVKRELDKASAHYRVLSVEAQRIGQRTNQVVQKFHTQHRLPPEELDRLDAEVRLLRTQLAEHYRKLTSWAEVVPWR